jgi:hypothetical protein
VEPILSSPMDSSSVKNAHPPSSQIGDTSRKEWRSLAAEAPTHEETMPQGSTLTGKRPAPKRKRLTVYLPMSLLERLRNTVYWTRGTTLAGLLEAALSESLDQREIQRGSPFPQRLEELKGGRPKRYRSGTFRR